MDFFKKFGTFGTFGTAKSLALAKNLGWQAKSAKSAFEFDHPPLAVGEGVKRILLLLQTLLVGEGM